MFAFGTGAWGRSYVAETGLLADATLAEMAAGLMAGTQVATRMGWRDVAAIAVGDEVMTFDGGMQPVTEVPRRHITTKGDLSHGDDWLIFVPAGALGNRNDMSLLPNQAVMIEADAAEEAFGDPFVTIPALALDGFRGITRVPPAQEIEFVTLAFAQDQMVFAEGGALVLCKVAGDLLDMDTSPYQMLDAAIAQLLVTAMLCENDADAQSVPFQAAA